MKTFITILAAVVFIGLSSFEYRPIGVASRTVVASTAYQPSTSRYTNVTVSVQISCTISLTTGQAGSYSIQTSPDGTTYTTIQTITNSNSGSLTIGLNLTNTNGGTLNATVVPGGYYKLVTTTTTGTPTFTILNAAQEVSL